MKRECPKIKVFRALKVFNSMDKVRSFAAHQFVADQLRIVAQNARGSDASSFVSPPPLVPSSSSDAVDVDGDMEQVEAGGVLLSVPVALSSLDVSSFLSLLTAGWALLSSSQRTQLEALLPSAHKGGAAAFFSDEFQSARGPASSFGFSPIAQFLRRFRLGLLQPKVVVLRARIAEASRRLANLQVAAASKSAESGVKTAKSELALFRRLDHTGQMQWPEIPDEVDSAESELSRALVRPARAPPVHPAPPKRRKEAHVEDMMAPSPAAGGIALDERSTAIAGGLTRAQKKTQSRIIGGMFLSSFNTIIKMREMLLLRKRQQSPLPAAPELVALLAADPVVANDSVDGMNASQFAHVSVLFAQQVLERKKEIFLIVFFFFKFFFFF